MVKTPQGSELYEIFMDEAEAPAIVGAFVLAAVNVGESADPIRHFFH